MIFSKPLPVTLDAQDHKRVAKSEDDQSFETKLAKDFTRWLWIALCVSANHKKAGHTGHARRLRNAALAAVPLYGETVGHDALSDAMDEVS